MVARSCTIGLGLVILTLFLTGCPPVVLVSVTPATSTLEVEATTALTATSTDTADTFTWSTSSADIVTLSATTGASVTATAVAPGLAAITVTGSASGQAGVALIAVTAAEEPVVSITPNGATLNIGAANKTLTASSTDADDTTFAWTTSDATIVGLSAATGTSVDVIAVAQGSAAITATGNSSGKSAVAFVAVLPSNRPVSTKPGLKVTILSVTIPADLKPEVQFTATDDTNVALQKSDFGRMRFMLDYLETPASGGTARFLSYTTTTNNAGQPTEYTVAAMDGNQLNGITQNVDGSFKYKFRSAIPSAYSQSATHRLGGQITRVFAGDGQTYVANPLYDFRPDGQPVTQTRDIVTTEACNTCHTRMGFHGGTRREAGLCILCHNTQSTDSEKVSVDMPVMIHKIHMGSALTTPYLIAGHDGPVDLSSGVEFPQDIRNCAVCHTGSQQVQTTTATRAGCASCHDNVWFGPADQTPTGFENHPAPQENDLACSLCHAGTLSEVHKTPEKTDAAVGLELSIASVTPNPADGTLRAVVHVANGDGSPVTALSQLARLGLTVAYPASNYQTYVNERFVGGTPPGTVDSTDAANGNYGYTFAAKLPIGTSQTFALGAEGRRTSGVAPDTFTESPAANPIAFFTTDGSEPVPRRDIVDEAQCMKCHERLALHGGSRVSVPYCLFCHNPNKTAGEGDEAVSVNFDILVHKLHTGEEMQTAYPWGEEIKFPGDRRDCEICHLPGTSALPLPTEAVPTVVTLDAGPPPVTEVLSPATAACTSCHDGAEVVAHATAMAPDGEDSCSVCHGSGAHAIEP